MGFFRKLKKTAFTITLAVLLTLLLTVILIEYAIGKNSESEVQSESTLNGNPLTEFSIVYSEEEGDYNRRAAEYIKAEILERTGIDIPITEDGANHKSECEIIVGETSRGISSRLDAHTEKCEFAILADNNKIAIEGDYFIIAAAAYFFIETYVPSDNFSAEIPKEVTVHEPITEKAENFILLIGDGMGLYQTLLFDVFENNESYSDGEEIFYGYRLPYTGFARTRSLSGTTDSAAAGTALACGIKTKNSVVGRDENYKDVQSITELAASLGKSTAVMSTEASSGATPASFSAHSSARGDTAVIFDSQNALKEKYGTIINCGFNYYTEAEVESIEENIAQTLRTLARDKDGFFLMYEEAHIDKFCHNNDMENAFRALLRFNQAIATFMEYAFYNPNTMVIITADHETGKLLPTGSGGYKYNSTGHSSYFVPVFAFGEGAELFGDVIIENVQIPQTIAAFMGKDDFGDQTTYKSLTLK